MEEANPIEANDSDYDPNKEAKKEVRGPSRLNISSCGSNSDSEASRVSEVCEAKKQIVPICLFPSHTDASITMLAYVRKSCLGCR